MESLQLGSAHDQVLPSRTIEEAIKTMRKLPVFGYTANGVYKQDYEWPTAEDLRTMPKDQPIRAAAFNWKKCDQVNSVIGGL